MGCKVSGTILGGPQDKDCDTVLCVSMIGSRNVRGGGNIDPNKIQSVFWGPQNGPLQSTQTSLNPKQYTFPYNPFKGAPNSGRAAGLELCGFGFFSWADRFGCPLSKPETQNLKVVSKLGALNHAVQDSSLNSRRPLAHPILSARIFNP